MRNSRFLSAEDVGVFRRNCNAAVVAAVATGTGSALRAAAAGGIVATAAFALSTLASGACAGNSIVVFIAVLMLGCGGGVALSEADDTAVAPLRVFPGLENSREVRAAVSAEQPPKTCIICMFVEVVAAVVSTATADHERAGPTVTATRGMVTLLADMPPLPLGAPTDWSAAVTLDWAVGT